MGYTVQYVHYMLIFFSRSPRIYPDKEITLYSLEPCALCKQCLSQICFPCKVIPLQSIIIFKNYYLHYMYIR